MGSTRVDEPLTAYARTQEQIQNAQAVNSTLVSNHLLPLFLYAADIIPTEFHASTFVHYQATAGMRLIPKDEQHLVYDALYEGLHNNSQFVFSNLQRENIATLDGEEEALYGAVAANYLKGVVDVKLHMINKDGIVEDEALDFDGPLGALDMGGASMQIVYLPHEEFEDDELDEDAQYHLTRDDTFDIHKEMMQISDWDDGVLEELPILQDRPNRLNGDKFFSTSYLSYGADQFRERLWNTWITESLASNSENKVILNPCSFNGYESEWKGFTLRGTGDAKKCTREVNRLIPHHQYTTEDIATIKTVGGVSHPPIRGHFFAMSLFFFTLDCLRELSGHENLNDTWPTPKIADLTEALDMLCSRDWNDVSFVYVGQIFNLFYYFIDSHSFISYQQDLSQIPGKTHEFTRPAVLPYRCFESVYMVTLLRDGFGFKPESKDITFTFLVDGNEVEWSMGMAISHFAEDHLHSTSLRTIDGEIERSINQTYSGDNCTSMFCHFSSKWQTAMGNWRIY